MKLITSPSNKALNLVLNLVKHKPRLMKSFTLIETLMAVAVFVLALGATMAFISSAYKVQGYSWQQATAINEARKGIETMVREIREAKTGQDGSYAVEKAENKEFIFYSDIDRDGDIERVRYFLGSANSGSETRECQTLAKGGSCSVTFSNFLLGILTSAQVKVSVDGDFGLRNREYAEIFADSQKQGDICQSGCSDCPAAWQGTVVFDVKNQAQDNQLAMMADARSDVDPVCPHAMKAKFEFSFNEDLGGLSHEFRKGVVQPVGDPAQYPLDQEQISVLSSYVRNVPPIFEYFDAAGAKITNYPARLKDTKLMKVFLSIDQNPAKDPPAFELESSVQLRNLKQE